MFAALYEPTYITLSLESLKFMLLIISLNKYMVIIFAIINYIYSVLLTVRN